MVLCDNSAEIEIRGGPSRVVLTIRHESTVQCATTVDQLEAVLQGESIYLAALWTQCRMQRVGDSIELHYNSGTRWHRVAISVDWFMFAVTGLSRAQEVSTA